MTVSMFKKELGALGRVMDADIDIVGSWLDYEITTYARRLVQKHSYV